MSFMTFALLILSLQERIQQADIVPIADLVLERIVPPTDMIGTPQGTIPVGSLPLFIDVDKTASAFRKLNPALQSFGALKREYQVRSIDEAEKCSLNERGSQSCKYQEDGVYVAISDAGLQPQTGEIVLKVLVSWNGKSMPTGYVQEVFLRKVFGIWVLRKGVTAVS